MEIIVKNFQPHYNVALGKVVTSQRQYNEEIKRGGYIPYDQAKEITAANMEKRNKFSVSDKSMEWMKSVKDVADKDGNVKLSDNQIEYLKGRGMTTDRENPALKAAQQECDSRLPEHYRR